MEITRRQLIKAIKDMNQVMELDPPIDTSGSVDSILDQLDEAIESCVDPADEFVMETWDIINARQNGELAIIESSVKGEKQKQVKKVRDFKSESGSHKIGKVRKGRNIFGRMKTSRYGKLDELLLKGTSYTEMVNMLMENFSVDKNKALFTAKRHIANIKKRGEAKVFVNGDEVRIEVDND